MGGVSRVGRVGGDGGGLPSQSSAGCCSSLGCDCGGWHVLFSREQRVTLAAKAGGRSLEASARGEVVKQFRRGARSLDQGEGSGQRGGTGFSHNGGRRSGGYNKGQEEEESPKHQHVGPKRPVAYKSVQSRCIWPEMGDLHRAWLLGPWVTCASLSSRDSRLAPLRLWEYWA